MFSLEGEQHPRLQTSDGFKELVSLCQQDVDDSYLIFSTLSATFHEFEIEKLIYQCRTESEVS